MAKDYNNDFLNELLGDDDEQALLSAHREQRGQTVGAAKRIQRMKKRSRETSVNEIPVTQKRFHEQPVRDEIDEPNVIGDDNGLVNPFANESNGQREIDLLKRYHQEQEFDEQDNVDSDSSDDFDEEFDDSGVTDESVVSGDEDLEDGDSDDPFSYDEDFDEEDFVDGIIDDVINDVEDDAFTDDEFDEPESIFEEFVDDEYDDEYVDEEVFGTSVFRGFDVNEVIATAIDMGASDVHLTANTSVFFRINGLLERQEQFPYPDGRTMKQVQEYMTTSMQDQTFARTLELDFSYVIRDGRHIGRRVRGSASWADGNVFIVMRLISDIIPDPKDLGVPDELLDWAKLPSGLVLLNGPTGSGKALRLDTPIPTPSGWSTMGDIRVGDTVFDARMMPTVVTEVSDVNMSPELYCITFADGQKMFADKDHQWVVSSELTRGDVGAVRSLRAGVRSAVDELELMVDESGDVWGSVEGLVKSFEGTVVESFYGDVDSVENALSFMDTPFDKKRGFFFGQAYHDLMNRLVQKYDYSVSGRLYNATTKELLGELSSYPAVPLVSAVDTKKVKSGTLNDAYMLGASRGVLAASDEYLEEFPKPFMVLSQKVRMTALQGFLDSFGSYVVNGMVSFRIASQQFAVSLLSLIRSLGYKASVSSEDGVYIVSYEMQSMVREQQWNEIVSIELVPTDSVEYGAVRCISVDSVDSTYLCGDFVVTHNSSTLAAILRQVQLTRKNKIITIEKPVEFMFPNDGFASINQREVGVDTKSFGGALTSSLRQDPDVIMIGEVRNKEEIMTLLDAADTGHLAMSTLHTKSAPATLNRIKAMFEGDEQSLTLLRLSDTLQGIANQALLIAADGKSRFAVREVLPMNKEVRRMVALGQVEQLTEYMREKGIAMEQELARVAVEGRSTVEEARGKAADPEFFDECFEKVRQELGSDNIVYEEDVL